MSCLQYCGTVESYLILNIHKAFFSGDKGQGQRIKSLITEALQRQERKFGDSRPVVSHTSFIFATNDQGLLPSDANDKRHFVLDCREDHAGDEQFYSDFSNRLKANNEMAYKVLGYVLLKGWTISPSFGRSGQNPPTTHMMLVQRQNNYNAEEGFVAEVLHRGWIVRPDDLVDCVFLTGNAELDKSNIWSFHTYGCAHNTKRYNRTFEGTNEILKNTLVRPKKNPAEFHNLIQCGRINPYDRDTPPKRSWHRVIAVEDINRAFDEFCRVHSIKTHGRVKNRAGLLKTMMHFMFFQDNPTLNSSFLGPPTFSINGGVLCNKRNRADPNQPPEPPSIRKDVAYMYLPPLAQCRARFTAEIGQVFKNKPEEGLDTSIEDEVNDIRRYMTTVSAVVDYGQEWPFEKRDFGQFPTPVPAVDPVTGFARRPKRKLPTIEEIILPDNKRGSMDDHLEVVHWKKKMKLSESQSVPVPDPVPVIDLDPGDLAFMVEEPLPIDDPPVNNNNNNTPVVVEDNNTNEIFGDLNSDDLFDIQHTHYLDYPYGDEMFN